MKEKGKKQIGVILLAAGSASRMGMPKQLMVYQQKPLILHMLDKLMNLQLPITVVLGARSAMIKPVIAHYPIQIVTNSNWALGMGGSMQLGLQQHFEDDAVLVTVVDQPLLTVEVLHHLLASADGTTNTTALLVATRYRNNVIGVPALFGQQWYQALLKLPPKVGARRLLRQYRDQVQTIDFPEGNFDLDKPEDWENFRRKTE